MRTTTFFALISIVSALASAARADDPVKVLWDTSHGEWTDASGRYAPNDGYYTTFQQELLKKGFKVETDDYGDLAKMSLDPYRIIIVSVGTAANREYSSQEVAVIKKFVDNCGGLLIFTKHPGMVEINNNVRPVMSAFGFTFAQYDVSKSSNQIDPSVRKGIFDGVGTISLFDGGDIQAVGDGAKILVKDPQGYGIVGSAADDRVIAIGDVNFADDQRRTPDNLRFILNVFDHVKNQSPGPDGCGDLPVIGD